MSDGFFLMHRGWRDNPIFKGEFSRADAWVWLIENACWKPIKTRIKGEIVTLDRGQLSFSIRFLAETWGWSKSRVDRFLAELRSEGMIQTCSKIGTPHDQKSGQGQSIITISNYRKYQDTDREERDNSGTASGTTAGQQRDKEEQRNKETIQEGGDFPVSKPAPNGRYAFEGRVIKLNQVDFDLWKETYHAIPDLKAELLGLDLWWTQQPVEDRRKWFVRTSSSLNRKHQELLRQSQTRSDEPRDMIDVISQRRREEREYLARRGTADV